jgi:hypothetical protein
LLFPGSMLPAPLVFISLFLAAPTGMPIGTESLATRIAACDARQLPPNIQLQRGLESVVQWALEYSPRFRAQCRTLAAVPRLRATVRIAYRRPGVIERDRARAIVKRFSSGIVLAEIELKTPYELPELLAHEFEHVIEQMDGVDLRQLARLGEADRLPNGSFETRRAVAVGQQVAGEVVDNSPDRVRSAGASMWHAVRGIVSGPR